MSKKNKPSVGDPGDDAENAPSKQSAMEKDLELQDREFLKLVHEEGDSGGYIVINRRTLGGKYSYLDQWPARDYSKANIKSAFEGGDYLVQYKRSDNTFGKSIYFSIEGPPKKTAAEPAPAARQDNTPELVRAIREAMPPPPPPPDNSFLLAQMKEQSELNRMLISSLVQKPAAPDPSVAMLTKSVELLAAEVRDLKNGSGPRREKSVIEQLKEFLALKEIAVELGDGGTAEAKPDHVGKLIEVLGPAGGVLAQALVAKILGQGVDLNQLTPEQIAQIQAAAQAPQLPPAAGAPAAAATTPENPMLKELFLKPYLDQFKRAALAAALKSRDAFEWADTKLDEIEAKYHGDIYKLANAEDWLAKIFGNDPELMKHVQWLIEMRNAILARYFVEEVKKAYAALPPAEPAAWASAFLDRVSVSWHDTLWNYTDPAAWAELFATARVGEKPIDAVWLEKLRAAFDTEMTEDNQADESTEKAEEKTKSPAAAKAKTK